jgi:hypothetical protein
MEPSNLDAGGLRARILDTAEGSERVNDNETAGLGD